jgi:NAD+ kinase
MRLGIVAHNRKKIALEIARDIITWARDRSGEGNDLDIVVYEKDSSVLKMKDLNFRPIPEMEADIIICIGGDGTILRTLQQTEAPVLGINAGSLGFLTEVPPDGIKDALSRIIEGNYEIEHRSRIKTLLNGEKLPDATNEAVLSTNTPSKIQIFDFYIDMEWAQTLRADGIIISTPTGSTSYAFSAGGSVLDPRLEALEIVPIAPFRINARPIIIPDRSVITLKVAHKTRGANLVLDGYFRRNIKNKDELLFTRSKMTAKFIRFDMNFYSRFAEKIIRERPILNKKGKY